MKQVYLIAIGKLKSKEFEELENNYLKRINAPLLKVIEVKARAESPDFEAKEVVKKVKEITKNSPSKIILLHEQGKEFNSCDFSKYIDKKVEEPLNLFFILGGAQGHGQLLLNTPHEKISLSKLTFPHKVARLLFIEQFYRAQTISLGHPYHN